MELKTLSVILFDVPPPRVIIGVSYFNRHVFVVYAHDPVKPPLAPDIEIDGGILRPLQVDHVSHVQVIEVAEFQLGPAHLRDELDIGLLQGFEDLLVRLLILILTAAVHPAELTEQIGQHHAGQADAHMPVAV
ncbi:hypothetical protein SDC9_176835 [bioreactor metagenome]|uniref:Uncharacterized protein n=1 Tax=bioreactor metagenome TaxID=1076179 RepID=A0A645GTT7_9ZZZZ